jgi:hypothetical protein
MRAVDPSDTRTCVTKLSDTLIVQRLAGTEFAVVADQAGFDRAAAYQLDNARDDARMREVAFSIR